MKGLFALFQDHIAFIKGGFFNRFRQAGHLDIVNGNAPLLDQAAGLAAGWCQLGQHQQVDDRNGILRKDVLANGGGRHVGAGGTGAEQRAGGLLCLVRLLLAVTS